MKKLKIYISVFKIRMINSLQYRAAAISGLMTQFFWGFMMLMIFEAFYQSGGAQEFSYENLVTYIWLQQAFLAFFMVWVRDSELGEIIIEGNIAYELVRPYSIYKFWFAKLLGGKLSSGLLRFPLVILIAFFLPAPYNLILPANPVSFIMFAVSLTLGVILTTSILILMYISMFKTHSLAGSFVLFGITTDFLGGHLIPIPLMPQWLQTISNFLPFRYTADLPFRIYSGHVAGIDIYIGILIEIIWILILFAAGSYFMNKATRNVIVYGG
jgi:ABC-2 type transport system permease protein